MQNCKMQKHESGYDYITSIAVDLVITYNWRGGEVLGFADN